MSGAISSLAKALAVELAPIRVDAVAPGVLRSPFWSAMNEEQRTGFYASVADSLLVACQSS
ncbi:MAG: hypothetical protein ABI776_10295 [Nocardioidaceae bacterium]